jgi:arrestin-related trafficking adapter 9
MCADVTPASSSSPSPLTSTRRSLLSRLALPLRSRTRNLTDFHIRPLEPHRRYSPGDVVKGAVVLTVVKPIRVTHLTVCLHGFVRVYKRANEANETLPADVGLTAARDGTKTQYFGNGHASLFQDEVTLCGEGRLEPGIYEFNFEMEFPSKGLPTSIDACCPFTSRERLPTNAAQFERGTISYMITSTITRPTSIAATSSCDKKLSLVETVDIALMRTPKPRTISLEPISKRARIRRSVKNKESSLPEASEAGSNSDRAKGSISLLPDESASQYGLESNANSQSPAPSDALSTISTPTGTESTGSSTTQSVRQDPASSSAKSGRDSQRGSNSSKDDKTITATIELLKSGCLPGDNLPLKISIKHTKGIKSLHGIIITLYRQGRIDSAPPLSRFVDAKGKGAEKLKHEEYYPKSRTGLSGLSLSAAGSSSMFRKDLAQTFAPLIVDPTTLMALVNASVRVPEDAFPTISNVPGEMISFKYCVEVVVDLGGKLAQQRHIPRVGAVAVSSGVGGPGTRADGSLNTLTTWGVSIIDTDHIRREKSVVACSFEVVVGSMDSSRRRRPNSVAQRRSNDWPEVTTTPATRNDPIQEEPSSLRYADGQHIGEESYPHPYEEFHDESHYPGDYPQEGYDYQHYDEQSHGFYPPPAHAEIPVPPPEVQDEEGLSEKERIRRAEERLLPSQPPEAPEGSSSSGPSPSAPGPSISPDDQEEDLYGSEDVTPRAASAPDTSLQYSDSSRMPPIPSAPALEDLTPGAHASDDKQELERQRMLAEASAPPEFDNADEDAGERSAAGEHEPSAPTLTEDEYGGPSNPESLPKYER